MWCQDDTGGKWGSYERQKVSAAKNWPMRTQMLSQPVMLSSWIGMQWVCAPLMVEIKVLFRISVNLKSNQEVSLLPPFNNNAHSRLNNKVTTRWEGPQSLSYHKQSLGIEKRWASVCTLMFNQFLTRNQSCTQKNQAFGCVIYLGTSMK